MTTRGVSAERIREYTDAGWWGTRTIGEVVAGYADERPDDTAFITVDSRSTWRDYHELSDRIAAGIVRAGLAVGDRIGLCLPDGLPFHSALVGAQRAGVVAVGIGSRAGDAEIAYLLARTGAACVVVEQGPRQRDVQTLALDLAKHGVRLRCLIEIAADHSVSVFVIDVDGRPVREAGAVSGLDLTGRAFGPNDFNMLNSTSGTTGLPKCVMQFENRFFHFANLAIQAGELTSDDVVLGAVPGPFGFGLWTVHFTTAVLGAPAILLPRFSVDEMIRLIERERVTVLCCVTTQFRMMLNSPLCADADLSSLRVMFTGGEAIPYEQAAAFEERTGAVVLQFYGSNESGAFSQTSRRDTRDQRLRTAGRLIPEMKVRLFDNDGADITDTGGPGQPGGTGPLSCLGYYDDEAANVQLYAADGSLLMGDIVTVTDGYLQVVGRKSDIIIRGGKNISAAQVEAEVGTHPAVDLVAVVAVPDEVFGERVCALVSLRSGATLTLEQLTGHLAARGVTKEWYPEHLIVVDEIPQSSGGKVAKNEARRVAVEHLAARN
jgi:acyl-CoA synthetase